VYCCSYFRCRTAG